MSERKKRHGAGTTSSSTRKGKKNECKKCKGTGTVSCSHCGGDGKVTCNECNGTGKGKKICPVCNRGKISKSRWINCKKCHGSGQIASEWVKCDHCGDRTLEELHAKGSRCRSCSIGRYREEMWECPDCDGRGQVKDTYYEFCPNCHGEWQMDGGPCKECNGTGRVPCSDCDGTGKEVCDLCEGAGNIDIEAICESVIDIAKEMQELSDGYMPFVCRERITDEMAAAIFDAANRGVGIAACVAAGLLCDHESEFTKYAKYEWPHGYLRQPAEAGNMIAQYMGPVITGCEETLQDEDLEWLRKSAEQGFVPALAYLAACYYENEDDWHKRDLHKAMECWQKILLVKDDDEWNEQTIEMAELYVKYLPAIINKDYRAMLELGKSLIELQPESGIDYCTCVNIRSCGFGWLREAESAIGMSDKPALRELAQFYWDVGEKKSKAEELYKKMADDGDAISQAILGEHLREGDFVKKDPCKAFVYFYRAAEQDNISAINALAGMYWNGEYVQKNYERAVELYSRSAKLGSGYAHGAVGVYYLKKEKDEAEAKRLFQLAIEKGYDNDSIKAYLAKIPDSVKASTKKPSGIKGVPDKGPLPKFLKDDYEQAVAGKPALTVDDKESKQKDTKDTKEQHPSAKKRWKFVVLGILFGFLGLHLAYAKRWTLFLLLWAGLVTGGSFGTSSEAAKSPDAPAPQVTQTEQPKSNDNMISNIGFAVWALLWIGGTLFIKKDGKGNRM